MYGRPADLALSQRLIKFPIFAVIPVLEFRRRLRVRRVPEIRKADIVMKTLQATHVIEVRMRADKPEQTLPGIGAVHELDRVGYLLRRMVLRKLAYIRRCQQAP